MAAAQLKRTRREVLGAVAAVPVVALSTPVAMTSPLHHAALGSPPRPGEDLKWSRAVAGFEAASARLRGVEGEMAGLPFAAAEARQGAYDVCVTRFYGALRRVLRAPAPDVGALAWKLSLAVEHEVATLTGGEACMAAIVGDALRLSSGQARRLAG